MLDKKKDVDICIIGAGASGLVAAVTAGVQGASVFVIEKKEKIGAKIAASGNGRCNLSNTACEDWPEVKDFFASIGVLTRTEEGGRIYPYSEDAKDVIACLERAALRNRVTFATGFTVENIESGGSRFVVNASKKGESLSVTAKVTLLATGGKSAPKLGTSGDGYIFARNLGHTVSKLIPALTAVETKEDIKALGLSGVRQKCEVSLWFDGEKIFSERGEVQFTDYGLSGICVMNLSRSLLVPEGENLKTGFSRYEIKLDFLPDMSQAEVQRLLTRNLMMTFENEEEALSSITKAPLAKVMGSHRISGMPAFRQLKELTFRPKGLRGWDQAQVTKGGVLLTEIDEETMESKVVPGLYIAGETLDYDGPCGGFNLQHAWYTGLKAGRAMGNVIKER